MIKIFRFKSGIVYGTDMQTVVGIIPELETQFKQRKEFFEYYFTDKEIEVTLNQLDALAQEFIVTINWESITIDN